LRTYLTLLGLWERRHEPVGGFSKGMQQKLAIARALLHEPPVLFLDEPTSALDPEAARVVRDFIETLRGEGRTIFICTHNLDEADRLCDRVGVIRQRLIRVDTPEALRRGLYGQSVLVRLQQGSPGLQPVVEGAALRARGLGGARGLAGFAGRPRGGQPGADPALVAAGAAIQFVEREAHSLEKVYFDLMRESEEAA
jgi:ABC-2 type transport system ATP-binding protein